MERSRGAAKVLGPKAGTQDEAKSSSAAGSSRAASADDLGSNGRRVNRAAANGSSEKSRARSAPEGSEADSVRSGGSNASETSAKKDKKQKGGGGQNKQDKSGLPKQTVESTGVFATLAKLKAVPAEEQRKLLEEKLLACKVVFDFTVAGSTDQGEKEGKKQTLAELTEHFSANVNSFDEDLLSRSLDMIGANIFRALMKRERSHLDVLDPEDDSPSFDPAWPHLEVVYDFLMRIVRNTDASILAKVVDRGFLLKVLELFDSEDPRERECLKATINKVYTRLAGLRTCIRRGIHNVCLKVIYENGAANGVAELLEILSRIISGFAVPLKQDHRDLFFRALVPLHKMETLSLFHSQLVDCLRKYIEKDVSLTLEIIMALFRFWPVTVAAKQVLFLNELEDMIVEVQLAQLPKIQDTLAKRLAACVACPNSDVAERALTLCKNGRVLKLITQNCRTQFPVVISALYGNATSHWANPVHKLTFEVLKLLMETDPELFDQSSAKHRKYAGEEDVREGERERRWALLRQLHDKRRARSARANRRTSATRSGTMDPARGSAPGRGPQTPAAGREQVTAGPTTLVLGPNCELALPSGRYGFMASWDASGAKVDVGFQALVVDKRGKIITAVHDNNNQALQGAVLHTRNEADANKAWFDSTVWVRPQRLPQAVVLLILVAVAYSGGHLSDLPNGVVRIVEESQDTDVARFVVDPNRGDVGPVACFKRNAEGGWSFIRTEEFVRKRHFMDILEPTLGRLIRELVPSVPKRHKTKLAFSAMEQGAVATLPQPTSAKWLFVSMGWDLASSASNEIAESVGISAVFLDESAQNVGTVFSGDKDSKAEQFGARPCSGGALGGGLMLDLEAVPQEVTQIALLINLLNEETTFELVQKPHCCIVDPSGAELMRYTHSDAISEPGLILARIVREAGRGRWDFQALGAVCSGHHWKQSLDDIKTIAQKAPHELRSALDDVKSSSDTKRSIVSL